MDSRLIKFKPISSSTKPLLLKDHLLDDMSSCSSNGFKSFPRRQCCTSARFLHEFDRKTKQKITHVDFTKTPPKSGLSALQRVITAVKRLPFGSAKSLEKKKSSINSFLPRSFSKKIFTKGGFWKRKPEHREIERWKSFDQLLKEDPEPSDRSCSSITTTDGSKISCSWSGSDFTASEGGNSASEASSNLPEMIKNDVVETSGEGDDGVVVTNDDVSAESTTSTNSSNETKQKQWSSDQEKEQFSPVSVLDCPFDDDDEVSSPFQHRLARMEGTRKKLLEKIQRFECLAKVDPVNLTVRFASHLDSDNEYSDSPLPHSEEEDEDNDEEDEDEEEKTLEFLDQMKAIMTSHDLNFKADKLMLDFFREGVASDKQRGSSPLYNELVEIVVDWIHGQMPVFMEWEVEKNRQAYVEDMEKGGEWKRLDQENEVVLELENEMFAALLNEVLLDMTS